MNNTKTHATQIWTNEQLEAKFSNHGIFGKGHTVNGERNFVSGYQNSIEGGSVVALLGSNLNNVSGNQSFLTGTSNTNSGNYNVIGGIGNNINGSWNVSFGGYNQSKSGHSVLLGTNLLAEFSYCNLIGDHLQAQGYRKTILGRYNVLSENPFVVAYGSDEENRKNIFEVTSEGKAISKEVETEDVILKSSNGKKFKVTISDTGELITTKI